MRRLNYQRIRKIIKLVFAIMGACAGISACIVFKKSYRNDHAAVWAGVSAAFAILLAYIILSVWRDVQRKIPPRRFVAYMFAGALGTITGLSVFIAYLAIAISRKEPVDGSGHYVVVVWGFMTFKWSLLSLLTARSSHKIYTSGDEGQVIVDGQSPGTL